MFAADIVQNAVTMFRTTLETPGGPLALASAGAAAALIVAGSFVKTMIPLRWLAVGSNLGFMVYGALFPSLPMLVLHGLLLPINLYRAAEMIRLTRRVNAAAAQRDTSGLWLRPYMKRRSVGAGETVFRKGDPADQMYLLAAGRVELVEIGVVMTPGRVFGEIAMFSPDHQRTLTARSIEPCELLSIDEGTVRQLYFQNPEFGFQMIGLVAARLGEDVRRLEGALASANATGQAGAAMHNAPMPTPPAEPGAEPDAGTARVPG